MSERVGRAVLWRLSDETLASVLGLGIGIVLARLISPEEFGLFAILMFFLAISSLFVDSGFSAAMIQRKGLTYIDQCTAFWFTLAAGATATLVLVLISPWLAVYFERPELATLGRMLAIVVFLKAFLTVPSAMAMKELDFRLLTWANLTGLAVSGAVAIWLALQGWGVKALIAQAITLALATGLVIWWMSHWRPKFQFSIDSFKKLFSFGGFLMVASLMEALASRFYAVVIGKTYTAADVGQFYRATKTRDIPQGFLSNIVHQVSFPVFSEAGHDKTRLKGQMKTTLVVAMAINLPVMAGLILTAEQTFPIVFGKDWNPAIPYFMVLCGLGLFRPMHIINMNGLKAMGHARLMVKLELIKKSIQIPAMIVAVQVSITALAWTTVAVGLAGIYIETLYAKRYIGYNAREQFRDIRPYLIITVVMAIAVLGVEWLLPYRFPIRMLMAKVGTGVAVVLVLYAVFGLDAYHHGKALYQQARATMRTRAQRRAT